VITPFGDKTWRTVDVGLSDLLAIDTQGHLWAWGSNGWGQLGDGTRSTTWTATPEQIGSHHWTAVAAGYRTSMAIDQAGHLFTWGSNQKGQLADGADSHEDVLTPQRVGDKRWWAIDCAFYQCGAIDQSGRLFMWGINRFSNLFGIVGLPHRTIWYQPHQIISTDRFISVDTQFTNNQAIDRDGHWWSWGGYHQHRGAHQVGSRTWLEVSGPYAIRSPSN
jgi:alpha-tubulin suppressor-like RCC1 family protein